MHFTRLPFWAVGLFQLALPPSCRVGVLPAFVRSKMEKWCVPASIKLSFQIELWWRRDPVFASYQLEAGSGV